MVFSIIILILVGQIQAQVPGLRFGPVWEMTRTSSHIVDFSTTLRVPKAPDTPQNLVAIWPGINTDARPTNLVQTCILSSKTP
jgi:hypothetical protein